MSRSTAGPLARYAVWCAPDIVGAPVRRPLPDELIMAAPLPRSDVRPYDRSGNIICAQHFAGTNRELRVSPAPGAACPRSGLVEKYRRPHGAVDLAVFAVHSSARDQSVSIINIGRRGEIH